MPYYYFLIQTYAKYLLYSGGRILHILGLGIDLENRDSLKVYNKIKKAREDSIKNIIEI